MKHILFRAGLLLAGICGGLVQAQPASPISTPYGRSYQINVNAAGQNIGGDAANEPSLCIDPTNPNRIAVGWRQFDTTNSNFRQSGVAYTTNGGLNWTFPGNLDPGVFRSDPVLAADAIGNFYYLGISNSSTFSEDLLRSTNGGATWQSLGYALGGDKEWMAIDTTTGPGRGNIYQVWSPFYNVYASSNSVYPQGDPDHIFTRSVDGGASWMTAIGLPHSPYFGTLDVGPGGELYMFGTAIDIEPFVLNRSTNAQDRLATPAIDLTTIVDLGGKPLFGNSTVNPAGLLGQAWIAADRSSSPKRGNVYVLCTIGTTNFAGTNVPANPCDVVFSRSTDRGQTWSAPVRINDDSATQNAYHWFGTLSVASNGRVDACWNDTRNSTNNSLSELFYSWSDDAGLTWAANRRLSPQFNHLLGFPQQNKMGDYIGMVSLNEYACIAYTATFNGEEDLFFVRAELPIKATIVRIGNAVRITWNAVPGVSYCLQVKNSLSVPWSSGSNVTCFVASGNVASVDDPFAGGGATRFYRVVRQP